MAIASLVLLLGVLARPARADDFEPRVSPETARWISIATTTAGLSLSGYLWVRADGLEEGRGRAEMQLTSIGTGLLTMGVGPASGLLVAGEYRRGVTGALARPFLIGGGAVVIGMGAFVGMWGCFETNDCTDAKVGAGFIAGLGAAGVLAGVGWAAYDIWDTPRILEKRRPKRTVLAPMLGGDRIGLTFTIVN